MRAVRRAVDVPIVASGGAGRREHFADAFAAGADAALAASLFHYGELRIGELKAWLAGRGIPVRPPPELPWPDPERGGEDDG